MSPTRLPPEDRLLEQALRDYQGSPGRYSVALREPRLLYAQAHSVLAVAAGKHKSPDGGSTPDATGLGLQQAARFFIRQAFLRPGTDHYTLLGLGVDADAQTIREHYRLLIRLTHPDFESASDAWPPNTAARVNLAYDVLSSPHKRSVYDLQLRQAPRQAAANPVKASGPLPVQAGLSRPGNPMGGRKPARGQGESTRPRQVYIYGGLAAFATASMLVFLLASTPPEDASLRASGVPLSAPAPAPYAFLADTQAAIAPPLQTQPSPDPALAPPAPLPAAPSTWTKAPATVSATVSAPVSATVPAPVPVPLPVSVKALKAPVRQAALTVFEDPTEEQPMKLGMSLAMASPLNTGREVSAGQDTAAMAPAPLKVNPGSGMQPLESAAAVSNPTPAAQALNMRVLQPLLAGMVEALQSGNSAQVQRWIERATPQQGLKASAFASSYQAAIGGGRVVGLGQVTFEPRATKSPHQVDGTIHLNLEYADQQPAVRAIRLRAYFEGHPDAPKLSYLEAR